MKIYFNGCSYTWGDELEYPLQSRFSKLVCDHYGAEEINLSYCGKSNDAILRECLSDDNHYDLAIVSSTIPSRTEYYNKTWKRVHIPKRLFSYKGEEFKDIIKKSVSDNTIKESTSDHLEYWLYYYMNIVNDTYDQNKDMIFYKTIKSYYNFKNIPLIILTIYESSKMNYDINMSSKKYPQAKRHPNELGHELIASDLINIIKSRGYCNV